MIIDDASILAISHLGVGARLASWDGSCDHEEQSVTLSDKKSNGLAMRLKK